jgi:outer membrane receptor protein involved in Fe transport
LGNPDLKPESSSTIDFGLSYSTPNKFLFLDVTYFTTKHNDKIIENTLDSAIINQNEVVYNVTSYKNANNSAMNGIELVASTNIGALFSNKFKLELYGNLTYIFNNTVDETFISSIGNDSIVTRDLLYARKSNANFGIAYDNYKGFSTRIHARYIGSRLEKDNFSKLRPDLTVDDYYTDGGYTAKDKILQHPEYLVFDYSVAYSIKNYRFGITISNLFDENYTEKDGYNMPGRVLMANFNYSF